MKINAEVSAHTVIVLNMKAYINLSTVETADYTFCKVLNKLKGILVIATQGNPNLPLKDEAGT